MANHITCLKIMEARSHALQQGERYSQCQPIARRLPGRPCFTNHVYTGKALRKTPHTWVPGRPVDFVLAASSRVSRCARAVHPGSCTLCRGCHDGQARFLQVPNVRGGLYGGTDGGPSVSIGIRCRTAQSRALIRLSACRRGWRCSRYKTP
jgi:hypothetical protein